MRRNFVKNPTMRTKVAKKSIVAKQICKAFEENAEEIVEDAEEAVKEYFPARKVKAALSRLERKLKKEGISVKFNYTLSRNQLKKTANVEVTEEELEDALNAIVDATVEEFEDLLADTEEYIDETVVIDDDEEVKTEVEEALSDGGVECQFAKRKSKARVTKAARNSRFSGSSKRTAKAKRPNPILSKMR